jgi:hypothetical protein
MTSKAATCLLQPSQKHCLILSSQTLFPFWRIALNCCVLVTWRCFKNLCATLGAREALVFCILWFIMRRALVTAARRAAGRGILADGIAPFSTRYGFLNSPFTSKPSLTFSQKQDRSHNNFKQFAELHK